MDPGLRRHEVMLLRLVELVTEGTRVDIDPTGTNLKLSPGAVSGTSRGAATLDVSEAGRSIAWYLEPLVLMGVFARDGVTLSLAGVTCDETDPGCPGLAAEVTSLLAKAGMDATIQAKKTGFHSDPTGEVRIAMPPASRSGIPAQLHLTEPGLARRVRGTATDPRAASSARSCVKRFCPDAMVRVIERGRRGCHVSLEAHTEQGCVLVGDASRPASEEEAASKERKPPDEVGERASRQLALAVKGKGCVSPSVQALAAALIALGPQELGRVRVGAPTPHLVGFLQELRALLGVTLYIEPDEEQQPSVLLSTVGLSLRPVARRAR